MFLRYRHCYALHFGAETLITLSPRYTGVPRAPSAVDHGEGSHTFVD